MTVGDHPTRGQGSSGVAPRISMRDAFGRALVAVGLADEKVVVLDADVAHPARAHLFQARFPDRFFQVGIAEANMVGIAAGLAATGFTPFAVTFAAFMSRRACDQVSISVAYPRLNVKLIGAYAGLSTPATGASHQSVDDVAIMRALPNMVVTEPADPIQLERLMMAAASRAGPCYLRIVRDEVPTVTPPGEELSLDKGLLLREGGEVTLVGLGAMASSCLAAARLLEDRGIDARVINIHTVKPIDVDIIVRAAKETKGIVTVENHSVIGGLGGAVAELVAREHPARMRMVGIQDRFGTSGQPEDLLRKYGLLPEDIVRAAVGLLA